MRYIMRLGSSLILLQACFSCSRLCLHILRVATCKDTAECPLEPVAADRQGRGLLLLARALMEERITRLLESLGVDPKMLLAEV